MNPRRLFAIFLLVLLPFQFTWAAAAGYCRHESSVTSTHLGHHAHEHKADAKKVAEQKQLDTDCSVCHIAALQAVVPASPAVRGDDALSPRFAALPAMLLSAPRAAPERPQWLRLA